LMSRQGIANFYPEELAPIMSGTCRVVQASPELDKIADFPVPCAYKSDYHRDYNAMAEFARERKLDPRHLPYTLFVFRGLCYSSIANYRAELKNEPVVYLASKGRLSALELIISSQALGALARLRSAYLDLLDILALPRFGYQFTSLGGPLLAYEASPFTSEIFHQSPSDALQYTLELRRSPKTEEIRWRWGNRLWRESLSCSVGASVQTLANATVHGNVTMTFIHAVPNNRSQMSVHGEEHFEMSEPKQRIERVTVGGKAVQQSDESSTHQEIRDAQVGQDLSQKIGTKQEGLSVFGGRAIGRGAVIALAIVIIGWLLFQWLAR
jgi:hypothetical protein